jgi:hypothetical protein
MHEFKDDMGRSWRIHITCASTKRITAHAGFDFADISNGKAVELFGGDTKHLLDILWPLVKADADARGIDFDSFGDGLRGDCLADATAVLKEELLTFFPSPRRLLMRKLVAKMEKIVDEAGQKVQQEIDNVQMPTASGGTLPTSAPESLESLQTTGPCAS